jgi:hypothetical protein
MRAILFLFFMGLTGSLLGQKHDGISNSLDNLFRLSDAKTRSISPENFTGEKGKGGMATEGTGAGPARGLGQGWKISPSVKIPSKTTFTMAEINGSGAIQHMWLTPAGIKWRYAILRIYWDDEKEPSVEAPLGDFFCMGWNQYASVNSLAVCVNPGSAFNCYWVMPFRKKARITIENLADEEFRLYYQIDYVETTVPDDAAYFHAQFRRVNPLPYKDVYTLVDGIKGKGHYVGTYIAWGVHNNGWWGEGEIKFYIDGDKDFPTICGTGTEDYFCGSYDFDVRKKNNAGVDQVEYQEFNTPYVGLPQVIRGDGHYQVMQRFGMYRWHIPDPIRFEKDLKVTIQALGWRGDGRYLPLQDDISSVVFWYQTEPHGAFPKLPERDKLEVN